MIPTDARLLRLYVKTTDRWQGRPLYQAIVEAARSANLAGASVFHASLSYGQNRSLHDTASEYDAHEVPVVVEIVDAPEPLDAFLAELNPMIDRCMATLEPVQVVRYMDHETVR